MNTKQLAQSLKLAQKRADKLGKKYDRTYKATTLKYFSRLVLFKRANLVFDPISELGTSYNWYTITKRIGRTLVLNTYRYSVTTSKHVSELRSLFRELGLEYVAIEAPSGLQNLDAAMVHHTRQLARAIVANKYARIPASEKHHRDAIKFLARHVSKHVMTPFIEAAERERTERLARNKKHRAERAEYLAKRAAERAAYEARQLTVIQGGAK